MVHPVLSGIMSGRSFEHHWALIPHSGRSIRSGDNREVNYSHPAVGLYELITLGMEQMSAVALGQAGLSRSGYRNGVIRSH